MCQLCIDAIKKYWPDLSEEQYPDLLWNATAFPAGDGGYVARQVKEMAEKSGCDLGKAMAMADEEMTAAMRNIVDD